MLQEPEIERPEHQDDPDVGHQPLPELVAEEQDVQGNHDDYHREHVKHGGCLPSHDSFLLWATNRSKITSAMSHSRGRHEGPLAARCSYRDPRLGLKRAVCGRDPDVRSGVVWLWAS